MKKKSTGASALAGQGGFKDFLKTHDPQGLWERLPNGHFKHKYKPGIWKRSPEGEYLRTGVSFDVLEQEAAVNRELHEKRILLEADEKRLASVGGRIDLYRNQCGWTIEALAEQVNLNESMVRNHIKGRSKMRPGTPRLYNDAFNSHLRRSDIDILKTPKPK